MREYFHNENLSYAVNNWVGAALAAERVSGRRTLRILEVGAGPEQRQRNFATPV